MIVTHVNVNKGTGMKWMEEVIVPGLTTDTSRSWSIEAHGDFEVDETSSSENDDISYSDSIEECTNGIKSNINGSDTDDFSSTLSQDGNDYFDLENPVKADFDAKFQYSDQVGTKSCTPSVYIIYNTCVITQEVNDETPTLDINFFSY